MKYVALLRGINVGGNNKVPMGELKKCFESLGYQKVCTYINSGNVIFETEKANTKHMRGEIEACLKDHFGFELLIVLYESKRYQEVIRTAPPWWGKDPDWKHNAIFLIEPYVVDQVITAIGKLKLAIECVSPGDGVLFQSLEFSNFGKTTSGKLAGNPIYKKMTIRNYNTTQKLQELLDSE